MSYASRKSCPQGWPELSSTSENTTLVSADIEFDERHHQAALLGEEVFEGGEPRDMRLPLGQEPVHLERPGQSRVPYLAPVNAGRSMPVPAALARQSPERHTLPRDDRGLGTGVLLIAAARAASIASATTSRRSLIRWL